MDEQTPKERAREYIGKILDECSDWTKENDKFMEDADLDLYDQLYTENRVLEYFRLKLTKLQNIVNDIEEAS